MHSSPAPGGDIVRTRLLNRCSPLAGLFLVVEDGEASHRQSTIEISEGALNQEMVSGLTAGSLEGGSPFLVVEGKGRQVAEPFHDNGGHVVRLDIGSLSSASGFLVALHEVLPLPYGGLFTWDSFADSHEELAELWPKRLMLLLERTQTLARENLHLVMQLAAQMESARDGLAEFHTNFWPVFCLTD